MSWLKGRMARVRSLFRRREADARMADEFAFHIDEATEQNIRAGMGPAEARRRALAAFGGVQYHSESMREGRRLIWIEDFLGDVRFALRWLRRSPGFAAASITTIALGVGATTALFSVINAFLLRPLPVAEPERLYSIQEKRTGSVQDGIEGMLVPHARYEAYVEAVSPFFTDLAGHAVTSFALRLDGPAQRAFGVLVSGNYFSVLGVGVQHGRLFSASDEAVVVLSHRLWETRFGRDPEVVGRTIYLDGRPLTVAGIAARGFTGTNTGFGADLWVPYRAVMEGGESAWSDVWLSPFGRLRAGLDPRQVAAALPAIAQRIDVDAPDAEVQGAGLWAMTGLSDEFRPTVAGFLGLLLGMATLVLLIAAANIAGMQLARSVQRHREVAVRLAIGAGRGRLVRQLLTESLVLFLLGGAGGILLAWWATHLAGQVTLLIDEPVLFQVGPDLRVLVFGLAAAGFAGIGFGLVPALRASRPKLVSALKDGEFGGARRNARGSSIFVTAQIALAVVLLAVAGLFGRTLQTALTVDPGFDPNGVVIASFDLSSQDYDEERGRVFQTQLMERVRAMGDVESAALARLALLTGSSHGTQVAAAGKPDSPVMLRMNLVEPEYFRTLRVDLVAGTLFGEGAQPSTVVNETLARRLWPGEDPLGKRLRGGDAEFDVIGVTRDGRYRDFTEEPTAFAFFPLENTYSPSTTLHIRTRTPAAEMIQRVRDEIASVDPDVVVFDASPLTAAIGGMLLPQRIAAYLVGVFGLIALVLAGTGIYGVLSHHLAERTRELGIRVALGATARSLVRLVIGRVGLVSVVGIALGVTLASAVGRLIQGFVFGIDAHDPATFIGVPMLLAGVALLASFLPTRRAIRADPVVALRND